MDEKLLAMPNLIIGDTVINYSVEVQQARYCEYNGVPARNGWHIPPACGYRYCPVKELTLTMTELQKMAQRHGAVIEFIK